MKRLKTCFGKGLVIIKKNLRPSAFVALGHKSPTSTSLWTKHINNAQLQHSSSAHQHTNARSTTHQQIIINKTRQHNRHQHTQHNRHQHTHHNRQQHQHNDIDTSTIDTPTHAATVNTVTNQSTGNTSTYD
jgi:hypothetical protein